MYMEIENLEMLHEDKCTNEGRGAARHWTRIGLHASPVQPLRVHLQPIFSLKFIQTTTNSSIFVWMQPFIAGVQLHDIQNIIIRSPN